MTRTRRILHGLAAATLFYTAGSQAVDQNAVKDLGDAIPSVEEFKEIFSGVVAAQKQPKTRALGRQAPKPKGISSSAIDFTFGSDRLTERSRLVLTNLSTALNATDLSGVKLEIVGHTDGIGSDSYNMQLSRKRAAAVKNFIAKNSSVSPEAMEAVGVGKLDLKDPAHPEAAVNRRVEVLAEKK